MYPFKILPGCRQGLFSVINLGPIAGMFSPKKVKAASPEKTDR
jgi:hypothetical protein